MKKLLIVVAVILILALAGIGIFIATFDINAYKGIIISNLESITGNRVEIDRLSLKWQPAALLDIEGFKIYALSDRGREDLLSVEHADVSIDLAGLLMRQLRIYRISARRPVIHVIRDKDQTVEVSGYSPKSASSGKPSEGASSAVPAFSINIGSVEIEDGTVRFQDMVSDPASDITVRKIDAKITNISMAGSIRFTAKMAVASAVQNLAFSGAAGGFASGSIYIRDFDLESDLSTVDCAELAKAFPPAQKLCISSALAGLLKVKIRQLELSDDNISNLSADLSFTGGRLAISQLKVPVDRINLSVSCEGERITIKSFSVGLANGSLSGSGTIDDIFTSSRTTLRIALEVQGVKSFIYSVLGQQQNIDGNMRLSFDGTMEGASWPEISRTLTGGGEFYLDRGMMMNTNVLNQALGSLTLFPGLPDIVRGYVPAPIQQTFGDNDTVIAPLRQSYTIESGYVMIPNLNLRTDTFDMRGEAKSSLTGDISGSGMIRFARSVSDAMVKAVPEMRYMMDNQGMVEFPLAFKGGDNGFKVIPDMKYVGKKIAVQKAGEIVTEYLQKSAIQGSADKAAQPDPADSSAGASGKPPKLKDLIKSFMDEEKRSE